MSWSLAFEAKVIVKASLSFFWGKLFNVNGVHIHGIGVLFLLDVVVVLVVLEGEEGVSLFFSDLIGLFPDMFEVEGLGVPLVYGICDSVH